DLAVRDVEVDVVQGGVAAEALAEAAHLDHSVTYDSTSFEIEAKTDDSSSNRCKSTRCRTKFAHAIYLGWVTAERTDRRRSCGWWRPAGRSRGPSSPGCPGSPPPASRCGSSSSSRPACSPRRAPGPR